VRVIAYSFTQIQHCNFMPQFIYIWLTCDVLCDWEWKVSYVSHARQKSIDTSDCVWC